MNVNRTSIAGLGFCNPSAGLWRFADLHDGATQPPRLVGPCYVTKAELLVDLDRYARESWGYGATVAGEMKDYLVVVNEAKVGICPRNIHLQATSPEEAKDAAIALGSCVAVMHVYQRVG